MRTKKQFWYDTDLDFYNTEEALRNSRFVIVINDWKGRITFCFQENRYLTFQVTKTGKFSVTFPIEVNPDKTLSKVKKLLRTKKGNPIVKFEKYKEIPEPKDMITPLEEKVEKNIDHLRFLLMRDPTTTEIAYEVGATPEKIREVAFKLAPKLKWKEPSKEDIKKAKLKLKELYQIASLLQHFKESIVLTRPASYLGGRKWKDTLERARYALEHEKINIPRIKVNEETEEKIEFDFVWSRQSKYKFYTYPEYYYKETKELSGATVWVREQAKKALNEIKKLTNKAKEEK